MLSHSSPQYAPVRIRETEIGLVFFCGEGGHKGTGVDQGGLSSESGLGA